MALDNDIGMRVSNIQLLIEHKSELSFSALIG